MPCHVRDHPDYTPAEQRRFTDLQREFADSWAHA
ncbi:hypothetical protein SHIRM173S_07935 [Streptomyces hirsutus]